MEFILEAIQQSPEHKITFAHYMNLALYHPQKGYYSSGNAKIGTQGDFFTASSLGADFGELLAEQFLEMWSILGYPNRFSLVEVGAGAGFFAADILDYLSNQHPHFYEAIEYLIIEEAKGLIEQQKAQLKNRDKVSWKSWDEIENCSIIGCIFSNELIDAFPVHLVTLEQGKLQEIYVTISEGKITEAIADLSTSQLRDYFELVEVNLTAKDYPENYRTEVNLAALDCLKTVANKLKKGYLLTIDYGYTAQKYYHPQRYQGTLKCYYKHRHHDNPYVNIGEQDITTHVNFTALENHGELLGLDKLGFTQQGLFLMGLGLGDRLSDLSNGNYSFFEVIQRRDSLHQLIDPMGLGGFGVLLQSQGLTPEQKKRSLKGFLH
ncbi:protein of unknown function DUF185 [Rippkaea orientalis PCC 8801]|uniref:SAM-dependent methyltransferase n=1 Tax=Rippkaea orientalis (strain PCC 8801 / RF-1) TaxID=41431 RepID=B7K464_RIPO1|nr:SAM-dependent methyltransferase [Rippkaea orientalis]ACK67770.1 protein of unknown function DUF185 [Rippkaea orientalis PCC 8801]